MIPNNADYRDTAILHRECRKSNQIERAAMFSNLMHQTGSTPALQREMRLVGGFQGFDKFSISHSLA